MIELVVCCSELHLHPASQSPFHRVLVVDYYDGPIAGLAECGVCLSEFKYQMLAWDDQQSLRIYSFAPLPRRIFAAAVSILEESGPPRWPVWVPPAGRSNTKRKEVYGKLRGIIRKAFRETYVLAAHDLSETILAAKLLESRGLRGVRKKANWSDPDWFGFWVSYLGMDMR